MVRALASHQCGLGTNPGVDAICGLSLLLVLSFAPRGFFFGYSSFPLSLQKTFQIPIRSGTHGHNHFNEFLRTPKCSVGKLITGGEQFGSN